jgi:DNA-binding HxlR family transcriptional regulator
MSDCGLDVVLSLIGGKWKMLIMSAGAKLGHSAPRERRSAAE